MDERAPRFFASDNTATVHPAVMNALQQANAGHAVAYGDDPWTAQATQAIQSLFGGRGQVFFVYNGTGANVVAAAAALRPYQAVICTEISHIYEDECGAAERFVGCKLIPVEHHGGKLVPDEARRRLGSLGFEHSVQPRLLSITQATELGTVYRPEEVRALADLAAQYGLKLHMDGARVANATVSLGCPIAEFTVDAGVDILSFGATKNGIMFGEAVVVFDDELADGFRFLRKQATQLASKMRFIAAQFSAWLADDLWLDLARRANTHAGRLAEGLRRAGLEPAYPVEANGVFVAMPGTIATELRRRYPFYDWDPRIDLVRLMCSFDLEPEDIDGFLQELSRLT